MQILSIKSLECILVNHQKERVHKKEKTNDFMMNVLDMNAILLLFSSDRVPSTSAVSAKFGR